MNKYLSCLLIAFLLLEGCANFQEKWLNTFTTTTDQNITSTEVVKTEQILDLQVTGDINIQFITDSKVPSLQLKGNPKYFSKVQVTQNQEGVTKIHMLGTNKNDKIMPPVTIVVNALELESVEFNGAGTLQALLPLANPINCTLITDKQITLSGPIAIRYLHAEGLGKIHIKENKSDNLSIITHDKIAVKIEGNMGLRYLEMHGSSWLNAYWNDGTYMKIINNGESFAQLAGVVDTLEVELNDKAQLNTKYLRAKRAYIKTLGNSRADVFAKEVRNTAAEGNSQIYTYKDSDLKADNLSGNGVVLDFRRKK